MIKTWASFQTYCRADRASRGDERGRVRNFLLEPIARFLVLMRFNELLVNRGTSRIVRLPFWFWYRRLSLRLGYSIPLNVFGPGVALPHYGPIVIDPTTRIGRNCRMHVGVNIGGSNLIMDRQDIVGQDAPIIGDNVYIGPGVKMYGPVTIAADCVIGANAVVTRSFTDAAQTIAGVPARVISNDGSEGRLIKGSRAPDAE